MSNSRRLTNPARALCYLPFRWSGLTDVQERIDTLGLPKALHSELDDLSDRRQSSRLRMMLFQPDCWQHPRSLFAKPTRARSC